MERISVKLTGIAPLMMHNERLANPMDPQTAKLKTLATQRKKSEDLLKQIAELEWRLGIYEQEGRPVLPGDNVLAALKEGARKRKLGKQVEAAVFTEQKFFPLEYDGPKDVDGLWADGRFFDYRSVGVDMRRIMRARPRFDQWAVTANLAFDNDVISKEDLLDVFSLSGMMIGIGEKRPQFGRFSVEEV